MNARRAQPQPIRYGSVCSGIEAATVAWHPLGWLPQWFAEVDAFPSAVLAHHWPEVPNLGDFTTIPADAPAIDLLVGGTPCQAFSVAGLRGGLADERGNLAQRSWNCESCGEITLTPEQAEQLLREACPEWFEEVA
jgi:site-specific DNA-cytosine methylase